MNIASIPPEILSHILSYVETAQGVHRLSLTCQALHTFVEDEGWKIFVQKRFPSIRTPPFWRDASHALTTLSRNWDRKAFVAKRIEPANAIWTQPSGTRLYKWKRPRGQTMGYQPNIDCFEEYIGHTWDAKREVLAWSAGAELIMRITEKGRNAKDEWANNSPSERRMRFDQHRHQIDWVTYREPNHAEGRDDITVVKLRKPVEIQNPLNKLTPQEMIIGRANGQLQFVSLAQRWKHTATDFITDGLPVRSADLTVSSSPLLAACLGDNLLHLYQVNGTDGSRKASSEVRVVSDTESHCRTWSTRFLADERVAVGRGTSKEIVAVYEVGSTGIAEVPTRVFKCGNRFENDKGSMTSVYAIENLPPSTAGSNLSGNTFLSGCFDGNIRLHDMRSPENVETVFFSEDDSAIFSLQTLGRERFVAGGALNSLLKVFDLRMTGGRSYHYINAFPSATGSRASQSTIGARSRCKSNNDSVAASGWNLFLNSHSRAYGRPARYTESPVYSICSPSPSSYSLYAGTESTVVQLDFVDVLDQHPDPTFRDGLKRTKSGEVHAKNTWNPKGDALHLAMYEQSDNGYVSLKTQRGVGRLSEGLVGYDARWQDVRET